MDSGMAPIMAPISVVVPCYRCRDTIAAAVASVDAQTLRPREVLLVDDCSGDGTLECLRAIADGYAAGWIRVLATAHNGGPSGARNLGWRAATQEYIAFLDADDSWHPRKLELQLNALEADPGLALIAHRANVQPAGSAPLPVQAPVRVSRVTPRLMLLRNPFPTVSVVLRRDLPFRFDESRRRAEDYLLWAQIVLSGYRCAKLNQVLASWHKPPFGAGGLTGDLDAMDRAGFEVRNALWKQGLVSRWGLYAAHSVSALRRLRRRMITKLRQRNAEHEARTTGARA